MSEQVSQWKKTTLIHYFFLHGKMLLINADISVEEWLAILYFSLANSLTDLFPLSIFILLVALCLFRTNRICLIINSFTDEILAQIICVCMYTLEQYKIKQVNYSFLPINKFFCLIINLFKTEFIKKHLIFIWIF